MINENVQDLEIQIACLKTIRVLLENENKLIKEELINRKHQTALMLAELKGYARSISSDSFLEIINNYKQLGE
jgi:hypothetical protein